MAAAVVQDLGEAQRPPSTHWSWSTLVLRVSAVGGLRPEAALRDRTLLHNTLVLHLELL